MRSLPAARMRLLRRSLDEPIRAASRSSTAPEWEFVVSEIRHRVARRCRRYDLPAEEREEIEGDMLATLVETLRANGAETIRRFDPYVDVLIDNLCKGRIRQRHPVWTRLKDEIVEILRGRRTARGFALWRSQTGDLGGYASWEGRPLCWTERYLEMQRDLAGLQRHVQSIGNLHALSVARLLDAVFAWCGTPIPLPELASTLFKLRDLREIEWQEIDKAIEHLPSELNITADPALAEMADAMSVALFELPGAECAAFLLHQKPVLADRLLRGQETNLHSLALSLHLSADELRPILEEIPWSDLQIAERLGISEVTAHRTQQRIINLRQRAIQRMQRSIETLEGVSRDLSGRKGHRTPAHGA